MVKVSLIGYGNLYEVTSCGRVFKKQYTRTLPNGGLMSVPYKEVKQDDNKGYKQVTLSFKGSSKRMKVHRLVALCFKPNCNQLPQVNHIDGNKINNDINNLEWVTASQNQLHSVHVLGNHPKRRGQGVHFRSSHSKPWIAQISINGKRKHLGSFSSKTEAVNCYNNKVKEL